MYKISSKKILSFFLTKLSQKTCWVWSKKSKEKKSQKRNAVVPILTPSHFEINHIK